MCLDQLVLFQDQFIFHYRYVAIYLPMYYKTINTYKNAYMAIACSFVGGVILHIVLFFDHEVSTSL